MLSGSVLYGRTTMPMHATLASQFKCPLCGCTDCHYVKFPRADGSGRFYISPIWQCGGCSVIFADRDSFMTNARTALEASKR